MHQWVHGLVINLNEVYKYPIKENKITLIKVKTEYVLGKSSMNLSAFLMF